MESLLTKLRLQWNLKEGPKYLLSNVKELSSIHENSHIAF